MYSYIFIDILATSYSPPVTLYDSTSAISAPTRPRIVIVPASGLINPLSIFNSVVLIRAFPRRLIHRFSQPASPSELPCGSLSWCTPGPRFTLRAAFGSLPSGYPAAWFPAPLCPMSPRHSPRRNSKDTSSQSILFYHNRAPGQARAKPSQGAVYFFRRPPSSTASRLAIPQIKLVSTPK